MDGWAVDDQVPRLKRDWAGRHVRTRHALRNRLAQIPAGTVCKVDRNYGGLHLITEPCPCCGVQVYINDVAESSVTLLVAQEPSTSSQADEGGALPSGRERAAKKDEP